MTVYSHTIRPHPVNPLAIPLTEFPGAGYGSYSFTSIPGHGWGMYGTWREARAFAKKWKHDFDLPYVDVSHYPPFSVKSHRIDHRLRDKPAPTHREVRPLNGEGSAAVQWDCFVQWVGPHHIGASFMTDGRAWYELHRNEDGVPIGRKEWLAGGEYRYYINPTLMRALQNARATMRAHAQQKEEAK